MRIVKRVMTALRNPHLVREELTILLDYLTFRWRYRWLGQGSDRVQPGNTVLIVSLTHHPAYAKVEGMLLKSLQLKGCSTAVLTYRSASRVERYFRTFNIDQFVYFDDYEKRVGSADDATILNQLFDGSQTFASLLAFAVDEFDVGRHTLSTVVRKLRSGRSDFDDPATQDVLKDAFKRSLLASRAAEALLDDIQPQHIIFFHEKGYTPYGEIFDSAVRREIDTVHFAHSQRGDANILKRYTLENRRMHQSSLSAKSWEIVKQMPWSEEQEAAFMEELKDSYAKGTWFHRNVFLCDKQIKTPDEVRAQLGIDPVKKTAVVFSHVLWDATFFFGRNLFDDYEEWLVETVKVACENPDVNWLIKLHPDYTWKMRDLGPDAQPRDVVAIDSGIGELPSHVQVVPPETDISTYSFFQISDYCVTVRGTVGIEAPCFGIPVFTAGTGRYSGLGFSVDAQTREEYTDIMRRLQEYEPLSDEQRTLARKHAYAIFKLRLIPFTSFRLFRVPLPKLDKGMNHNTEIHVSSFAELEAAEDLQKFARFILESEDEDYLDLENSKH